MEAGHVRGNRDNPRFRLSLGLTSVRHIVDRLEAEYAQAESTNGSTLEVVRYDPDVEDSYIGYDDFPFGPPKVQVWNKFAVNFGVALSKCIPSVTLANFGVLFVATAVFAPRMISYLVLYPFCRLVFGTLYPAYASYKAVRTKNLKEYVKWMMYWIVFALFTCTETFTDVFLSWFPFYYEVKIVLVLWLLSPATKGSSILYRKFVHPALCRREQEIDEYIAKAKDQGYHTVLNLGTKGVNYATTVIMQTAIKGGGGLVQQLRKSYSLSDLTECEPIEERGADEADDVLTEPRLIRRALKSGFAARRSASESNSRQPMYFPEVDVDVRSTRSGRSDEPDFSHIKSTEDISSGYSSADNSAPLTRTGSVGGAGGAAGLAGRGGRARAPRAAALTAIKRPPAAEDNEVLIEELQDDDSINCANMPSLINVSSHLYLSHTNPPLIYQYVGDQVKIIQVLGQMPLYNEINFNSYQSNHQDHKEMVTENRIEKEHIIATTSSEQNNSNDTTANSTNNKEYTGNDLVIEEANSSTNKNSSPKIVGVPIDSLYADEDANNKNFNINDNEFKKRNENNVACVSDNLATNSSAEPLTDYYSSDDESSFGTPSDSPRMIKKNQRGKYGKNKAPLPPKIDTVKTVDSDVMEHKPDTDSKEITMDIDSVLKALDKQKDNNQTVCRPETLNPVSEIKRHQKSKSPSRIPKPSASGLGKLLQLPSKLTFWHKVEDKSISDNNSVSSDDKSRRGSMENPSFYKNEDDYAPLNESNDITEIPLRKNSKDIISFEDAQEFDTESSTQNIVEKSDVLQKLIEAKIESHPEYKYVPLNDEIPTTSISTDV